MGDDRAPGGLSRAAACFDFHREGKVRMNKVNSPVDQIKIALGIAVLASLMGCVGYLDGGYGGAVVVPGPDVYLFGGSYERGRDVRDYSHRGVESRAVAHPGAAAHAGAAGHGGKR